TGARAARFHKGSRRTPVSAPHPFFLPAIRPVAVVVRRLLRCPRMEIAKALILPAENADDERWPAPSATPRQLFPVANRPILFHNLEAVRAAGVLEATIMVETGSADAIREAG